MVTDILQVLGGAAAIYVIATIVLTIVSFVFFILFARWMMKR